MIGNNVTENQTFEKPLQGIEKLGKMWIKENIGIKGQTIVTNTLLDTKIAHRASVNGISKDMKTKIHQKIKEFVWGGPNKRARFKWEIIVKNQEEGGTCIKDSVQTLDAAKIIILPKLITRSRQPWTRWIEQKLVNIAIKWNVNEAMASNPSRWV